MFGYNEVGDGRALGDFEEGLGGCWMRFVAVLVVARTGFVEFGFHGRGENVWSILGGCTHSC
jgi:hypothetical protein